MTKLVGLTGFAGAGKDAVGAILAAQHDYQRLSFAGPMKDALYALNPVIVVADDTALRLAAIIDMAGWDVAKRQFPEIRELLQRFGTEAGRDIHGENCWIDIALRSVNGPTVFTDCRFPNECVAVLSEGGEVWRIVRPGVRAVNGHVSDRGVPDALVTRTIMNDGSMSDLSYAVMGALL